MAAVKRHEQNTKIGITLDAFDVYQFAEYERAKSASKSRRQSIKSATEPRNHNVNERPRTCVPRSDVQESPNVVTSRECFTANDFDRFKKEPFNKCEHLDQVCYSPTGDYREVLGPRTCHECKRSILRLRELVEIEKSFPRLWTSEENFSTVTILQRYYPNMSSFEIQDRIARGEIAKRAIPKGHSYPSERTPTPLKGSALSPVRKSSRTLKIGTSTYFKNLRDLNYKLITGRMTRSSGYMEGISDDTSMSLRTLTSPKRYYRTPSPVIELSPPLLPKENQIAEPTFFAGSTIEYTLPKRLPDKLNFIDNRVTPLV